tara:strand:+ start:416 stop:592 length:177 start_codon:yes stop_codon:yes gene_type:complete
MMISYDSLDGKYKGTVEEVDGKFEAKAYTDGSLIETKVFDTQEEAMLWADDHSNTGLL